MQDKYEKCTPEQTGNSNLARIMIEHLESTSKDMILYELGISERILSILTEIGDYIPESKQDKYNDIVIKSVRKEKIFTSENIKYILSLLIPILFQIFSNSQPEEMTEYEKQSLRNQEIISQQLDDLENLAEQIDGRSPDLCQVINALIEVVETIKDAEISEEKEQDEEPQNAVPDAQD